MEAIVYEEFGGPGVLHPAQVDDVHAGPGQIRVAVRAAGVNPVDYKIRNGWMEAAFPTPLPATPGSEFAGVVDETGEGVTEFTVGDEVLGRSTTGAYAEYVLADVGAVAPKPEGLGWAEAAALPVATATAARVLDELAVAEGETLLLHGASGAVGSAAVQLAAARGATVIGTASRPTTTTCGCSARCRWRTGTGWWNGSGRPRRRGWTRCSTRPAGARWRTRCGCAAVRPSGSRPSRTRTPPTTA